MREAFQESFRSLMGLLVINTGNASAVGCKPFNSVNRLIRQSSESYLCFLQKCLKQNLDVSDRGTSLIFCMIPLKE